MCQDHGVKASYGEVIHLESTEWSSTNGRSRLHLGSWTTYKVRSMNQHLSLSGKYTV